MSADPNDFPVRCRCGSTHSIGGFIECDHCPTWQHTLCYYETDISEDLPKNHSCDHCTMSSTKTIGPRPEVQSDVQDDTKEYEESLSRMLARLQLHENGQSNGFRGKQSRARPKQRAQTRPGAQSLVADDADKLWGPDDEHVVVFMLQVCSLIRNAAHLLCSKELCWVPPTSGAETEDLVAVLQSMGYTAEQYFESLNASSAPRVSPVILCRALLGAAIWKWIFKAEETKEDTIESVLLGQYQNIISARGRMSSLIRSRFALTFEDGADGLTAVQNVAWRAVVNDCSDRTNAILQRNAQEHACRLMNMLSSLLRPTDAVTSKKAGPIEDWTQSTRIGKQTFKHLTEAFEISIKQLKTKLPLARQLFELYTPPPGSSYDPVLMAIDGSVPEIAESNVFLTLSPAIVEYYQETELGKAHLAKFSASVHFVQDVTPAQRAEGRVICPALVRLA